MKFWLAMCVIVILWVGTTIWWRLSGWWNVPGWTAFIWAGLIGVTVGLSCRKEKR